MSSLRNNDRLMLAACAACAAFVAFAAVGAAALARAGVHGSLGLVTGLAAVFAFLLAGQRSDTHNTPLKKNPR